MAPHTYSARPFLCFLETSLGEMHWLFRLSRCSLVNGFIGHQFLCKLVLTAPLPQPFLKVVCLFFKDQKKVFIFPLLNILYIKCILSIVFNWCTCLVKARFPTHRGNVTYDYLCYLIIFIADYYRIFVLDKDQFKTSSGKWCYNVSCYQVESILCQILSSKYLRYIL